MSEELMIPVAESSLLSVKAKGSNYLITSPLTGQTDELKRNTDFGVIANTKRPTLYKPGIEKVAAVAGLMCRWDIVSAIEQYDPNKGAFFHYTVRCDLVKGFTLPDGTYNEIVFANGYGSANTAESANGTKSGVNSANSMLKKAQKRAEAQAVLSMGALSGMFTQDIEDETEVKFKDMVEQTPTSRINSKQRERIYNVAYQAGMTNEQAKAWLSAEGYPKSSEITVQQFEQIIEKLKNLDKETK